MRAGALMQVCLRQMTLLQSLDSWQLMQVATVPMQRSSFL
jgi:hypothetical protein